MGNSPSFSFFSYNVRSYNANSDSLFSLFHDYFSYPDVLSLTETWFQEHTTEDISGYNSYHTIRTLGRSGGVSVFIKNHLKSRLISQCCISNENIEICSVEICINDVIVFVLGVYRPHSGTVQAFNSSITSILDEPCFRNKLCILLGDFNVNLLSDDPSTNSFIYNLQSHHFLPLITKPTRFSPVPNSQPSLLDHIWINSLNYNFKCNIIILDLTDHCPIYMQLDINNLSRRNDEKFQITFRCHSSANHNKFENLLRSFNWNDVVNDNVNDYLTNFLSKLNELYCLCFPVQTKLVSKKHYNKPWITREIKRLLVLKSEYFKLLQFGIVSRAENNRFKNKIKSLIAKSKSSYFNNYFTRNKANLKKTWNMIKVLISQNLNNKSIKRIIWDNNEFSNDIDIANAFNQFFCNIGSDLDSYLPDTNFDPLSYVIRNSTTSFFLTPVRPSECLSIVRSLKNSKQPINNVPLKIFKLYSEYYIYTLCDLINSSFSSGIFPDHLKIAHTIPIFKKGDPTCINNYRPISILHFISKVFEKCLHSRLMNFLVSNNILSINQFGFLKQTSTEDAILKLVDYLYDSLNSKFNSINVFIDFKKAFDTINHSILIKKMEAYGIRGLPLELMANYLQNRKQFVKIGKTFSNEGQLTLGVPQGSVLGPLLFLVYINDLPNLSTRHQTILFADDTTLSFRGKNLPDLVQFCNTELKEFSKWAVANRLSISIEKTSYNLVSNLTNDLSTIDIKLNNCSIAHKSDVTFLGVILDEKLKYKDHINFICRKISKSIGILNKLKNLLPFFFNEKLILCSRIPLPKLL